MRNGILYIIAAICMGYISCGGGTQKPVTAENTIEDWKEWGVNTEHLFIFDECSMTYNGNPFMIGEPMTDIFELFGTPDRKEETSKGHVYFWDEIGIRIRGNWSDQTDEASPEIFVDIEISFNLDMTGYEEEEIGNNIYKRRTREQMISSNPYKFFQGKILVHGVPLGRGISIKEFQKQNKQDWDNPFFPRFYWHKLMTCDYSSINIRKGEVLEYIIYTSDDHSDIELFMVGTQNRMLR